MKSINMLIISFALMLVAGTALAEYVPPVPTCSTEITYTIKDSNGQVMDETTYVRAWPIDCVTQVQAKYLMLHQIFGQGEARFKQLTGTK